MEKAQPKAYEKKITYFAGPRIDDLFFGIEKDESAGMTCYYITVTPQYSGSAHAKISSSGASIGSDEEAMKFLERLDELKTILGLASF